MQAQVTEEQWRELIVPVLEGKVDPPNDMVDYFVKQFRTVNEERNVLVLNVRQLSTQLTKMQERLAVLDGESQARLKDIKSFWNKEENPNGN